MADDVILARFQGEVGDLKKKIDDYIASLEKAAGAEKGVQTELEKLLAKQRKSYQETGKLAAITAKDIKATGLTIAELGKKIRDSLDKPIDDGIKKVKQLNNETKKLAKETGSDFERVGQGIKSSLTSIAAAVGIAFSVGTIISFAKDSVAAFEEAEASAQRLKFAIIDLGGEGENAFQRLIDQAKLLQDTTTFNDEAIQKAQASLSNFGLSSSQIETIIPVLADFATVLGVDIADAADKVGLGVQGVGREFKKFGIIVSAENTQLENLNIIIDGLTKRQGAAEAATKTFAGQMEQLKNQTDELQEQLGDKLAPQLLKFKKALFEGGLLFLDDLKRFKEGDFSQLFSRDAKVLEDATLKVTKKVNELAKANIENGKSREEAAKISLNAIKQEQIANLELAITEVKRTETLKGHVSNHKELEKLALLRLTQARNELTAIDELIQAQSDREAATQKELEGALKANELKGLSIERLTELLIANGKENSIVAQSNVKLIEREIEALKKRNEELEKKDKRTPGDRVGLIIPIDTPDNGPELEANKKKLTAREQQEKEFTEFLEKENKKRVDDTLKTANEEEDIYERMQESLLASYLSRFEREISDTSAFLDKLSSVYSQFTSIRIENIEKEKEAKLAQLDIEEDSIEQQLDKRRISETEAQKLSDELLQKRAKAEADAQKKIRAEKRKAAILEKAAALVHIAIDTAKNSTEQPGPYGILIPFWVALGAAEAALVASQPTPYEKGTKHSKKGLARVGEKGEELMMLPEGTKIAPAGPSKKHSKLFDAMVDDDVDDYILKTWVTPRLEKQRREFEKQREISFAKNMADSIILNTTVQRGQDINNAVLENNTRKAADKLSTLAPDIAKALSPYLQHDIYR